MSRKSLRVAKHAETRVERTNKSESLRETLLTRLGWAHVTDVIFVPKIPVDRRHNAKTDLAAARAMVDAPGTRFRVFRDA